MKVSTFSKFGITIGAAALIVGAIAVPASADPTSGTYGTLVGLGSDTTQDVVNGLATAIGGGKLASYDAVGSTTVVTHSGGTAIPRASGSGSGRDLLRVAIGQTPSATVAIPGGTAPVDVTNSTGFVDFARSSGAPSSQIGASGVLTYIPFARDAVTVAFDPSSPISKIPLILGNSSTAGSSTPSLYNIYRGTVAWVYLNNSDQSYNSVGQNAGDAPAGTTAYKIQALLPKSGSGTRSYFIGKVGLTEGDVTTLKTAGVIKDTYGVSDTPIEEHDGTAINGDLTALGPFSISQWVAQANGISTDRRHGVQLAGLGLASDSIVAPTTGSSGAYQTNPAYAAMVRDVYNIVPSALADDPSSEIYKMFVGVFSLVCQHPSTITSYGFALMPGTTPASTCGDTTTPGMRAYNASPSSVALELSSTSVGSGDTFTGTATVTSTNNGGGTINFLNGDTNAVLGTATVANGETQATGNIAIDGIGTVPVLAEFIPNLAGVASSDSSSQDVAVSGHTSTSISTPSSSVIGDTIGVVLFVNDPSVDGGTIALKDGSTVIATADLGAGESGAYVTFTATALSYSLSATYTPPVSDTSILESTSSTKVVTVAKGTPVVSVPNASTVHYPAHSKIKVSVLLPGVVATGTVTVTEGPKTLVASATLVNGKVTITLPKLKKGTHTITVTYNGSATLNTAVKSTIKAKVL